MPLLLKPNKGSNRLETGVAVDCEAFHGELPAPLPMGAVVCFANHSHLSSPNFGAGCQLVI